MLILSSRKIVRILFVIAFFCCILGAIGQTIEVLTGKENVLGLAAFDLNDEGTVSAWYSSMLLLCSSGLLAIIAAARKADRFGRHWRWLSFIFLYLSLDEALAIHEDADLAQAVLDKSSFIYGDAWVFVGAAFAAIVAFSFRKFLLALPHKIRNGMLRAGAIYVGGAVGLEVVGSYFDALWGKETLVRVAVITLEEGLEMVGVILFIATLLSCCRLWKVGIQVQAEAGVDELTDSAEKSALT